MIRPDQIPPAPKQRLPQGSKRWRQLRPVDNPAESIRGDVRGQRQCQQGDQHSTLNQAEERPGKAVETAQQNRLDEAAQKHPDKSKKQVQNQKYQQKTAPDTELCRQVIGLPQPLCEGQMESKSKNPAQHQPDEGANLFKQAAPDPFQKKENQHPQDKDIERSQRNDPFPDQS